MRLWLARHPDRLAAPRPIIVDELLALVRGGHGSAVATAIEMLADLHRVGRECRFLTRLTGVPLWELKPASRGGERGGTRVYLFLLATEGAGVVNCEVKAGAAASQDKLRIALQVLTAYRRGIPVFEDLHP